MSLVADMPTDWANGKKITPNGESEGDARYGYNYLMAKINEIITYANQLGVDTLSKLQFETVTELPPIEDADPYTIYRMLDEDSTLEDPKYICYYVLNNKWQYISGQKITVDDALVPDSENPVQSKAIQRALEFKLPRDEYVIDTALDKESVNPVQNKVIYEEIRKRLRVLYKFKGSVNTVEDLPESGEQNDAYIVSTTGDTWVWDGTQWINLGSIGGIDPNDYYTKDETNALPAVASGVTGEKVASYDDLLTKVSSTASPTNVLVDKEYVDYKIQDYSAFFCGRWATYAAIPVTEQGFTDAGFNTPGFNNYLYVLADETATGEGEIVGATYRYIYSEHIDSDHPYNKAKWSRQILVNERPLTPEENAALQSGITSAKVATYDGYAANKQNKLTTAQQTVVDSGLTEIATTLLATPTAGQVVGAVLLRNLSETWTFTLEDKSTVTKKVVVLP